MRRQPAGACRALIDASGDPVCQLQSLECALGLALGNDRREEAEALASKVPAWPSEGGLRLLGQAFPATPEDAELLPVVGRLRRAAGDAAGALRLIVNCVRPRRRVSLDIFAIDLEADDTGETVFFEASASMRIGPPEERVPQDPRLPTEPLDRMDAAFEALVDARMRRTAAGP